MGSSLWQRRKELGPFAALMVAIVTFMALLPIVDAIGTGGLLVRLGFTGVLVAGLGVARESRRYLAIALVLLLANLVAQWLAEFLMGEELDRQLLRSAFGATYLSYIIATLLRALSRQREAGLDTVLGGINVYLLLALAFMQIHLFVERFEPGSYMRAGLALSDPASHPHESLAMSLFYFSFTTLTTLGYGDIAPARPLAQFLCSAEAVIGQLFVAIFIGGLVALRVGAMQRSATEEPSD